MVDRNAFELTESIAEAERLFIEDFDTWDMTGYYLYSKYWRAGVSAHIGTGGAEGRRRMAWRDQARLSCYQLGGALPNFAAGRSHCRGVLAMVIGDLSLRAIPKSVASRPLDQSASSAEPRLPAIPA